MSALVFLEHMTTDRIAVALAVVDVGATAAPLSVSTRERFYCVGSVGALPAMLTRQAVCSHAIFDAFRSSRGQGYNGQLVALSIAVASPSSTADTATRECSNAISDVLDAVIEYIRVSNLVRAG